VKYCHLIWRHAELVSASIQRWILPTSSPKVEFQNQQMLNPELVSVVSMTRSFKYVGWATSHKTQHLVAFCSAESTARAFTISS